LLAQIPDANSQKRHRIDRVDQGRGLPSSCLGDPHSLDQGLVWSQLEDQQALLTGPNRPDDGHDVPFCRMVTPDAGLYAEKSTGISVVDASNETAAASEMTSPAKRECSGLIVFSPTYMIFNPFGTIGRERRRIPLA
jgi:hypothetical protein